ncbi:MAG TPA: D-2-hydroxyacid dehydrogenase [Stellaceae bacterium]|jgi:phosphoglycerate dehydrogenase-like enzyme|nr:D-2-hydroxyacid dehydrogenase [Stellaceae bacterium]
MKAVLRARLGAAAILTRLNELPGVNAIAVESEAELAAAIADAELLLLPDSHYSAETAQILRQRARKLQWVQLLSAGYDAVGRHGIPPGVIVTNAGDAYAPSVATQAMALFLGAQRQFPILLADQKRHAWDEGGARGRCATPFDSTIAVLGFGHIGSEIGRLLRAFGAHVVAVTRSAKPQEHADESLPIAQLRAVLPRADAVVIALAASPETRHLIGAAEFALMKRSAVIVNIARGYIVDCVALAAALRDGAIGGAGLDVTEPEPLPADHPLWDAPNLIIAPHMAGAPGSVTAKRLAAVVGDNVMRRLNGEPLAYVVTP